jgi:uncharacterized protein with ParB-like and HNH nuclease domain
MAGTQISGSEHPIRKIFSDDFVFRIPPYQRPYAWGNEQAEELLEDLLTAVTAQDGPVGDAEPYFLGSIVLIKKDGEPKADVVDGQQRLTTLTILLACLRKIVGPKLAKGIRKFLFEEGNAAIGTEDRPRLEVRAHDKDFFAEYIQSDVCPENLAELDATQLPDSSANMLSNALLFLERLDELSEENRNRLTGYMLQRCYLVVVSTPNFDAAYRIFSVLNDRGMNLSHSDILKADVLGAIEEDDRRHYASKWEEIELEQGRDLFQELFGHIRTIYRKVKRRDTLVKEFREYVKPREDPQHFIDKVLKPYGQALLIIREEAYTSTHRAARVNHWFKWLNQIDNFDWLPPAMLYLKKYRNLPEALTRFFAHLERLAAGMMMYRANVNERIKRYAKVLEAIESGDDLYAEDSPLQLSAEEQREVMKALGGDLYNAYRIRKYALLRIDESLSDGEATYDHGIMSIEHVLPQNPPEGSTWLEWFPDPAERQAYTHVAGNLLLLSRQRNSKASNYDFEKKKEKYFKTYGSVSSFALTTQVVNEDKWTPAIVQRRQYEMLDKARQMWSLTAISDELLEDIATIEPAEAPVA